MERGRFRIERQSASAARSSARQVRSGPPPSQSSDNSPSTPASRPSSGCSASRVVDFGAVHSSACRRSSPAGTGVGSARRRDARTSIASASIRRASCRKPHSRHNRRQRRRLEAGRRRPLPIDHERHIGLQRASSRLFSAISRPFIRFSLRFVPGDFVGMVEHAFQRAVFRQQLLGDLRPDQRHARNVVGRVADERLKVDHLIGPDAPRRLAARPRRTLRSCGCCRSAPGR